MNRKTRRIGLLVVALVVAIASAAQAQVTRYVHFETGGVSGWGVLEGETIQRLSNAPWASGQPTGQTLPLSSVTLLAPADPKIAIVLNVNYPSGVERERDRPTIITLPPRALVGHGASIMRPADVEDFRAEPTVGVVIGKTATNISAAEAGDYIFGVAAGVDVTAEDWRPRGSQWTRSKGTDSFKPLGPYVVAGVDYNDLTIVGRHNGQPLPPVRTSDMIWDFGEALEYITRYMTLSPGDVVFAGTAGQDFTVALQAGDTFEVEVSGVGTLTNPVQAAPPLTTLPPPFERDQ